MFVMPGSTFSSYVSPKTLLLLVFLSAFGLVRTAIGQNATVYDYTVPVSSAKSLQFDFAYSYSATGATVKNRNGNLVLFYEKFYDSLPFAYSLDVNGSAVLTHTNPAGDFNLSGRTDAIDGALLANYFFLQGGMGSSQTDTSRFNTLFDLNRDGILDTADLDEFSNVFGQKAEDDLTYKSGFSGRGKKYFQNGSDFFGFGDFNIRMSDTFDRPDTDVTPGLGYGRFISATPLAKAVRIEAFLLKEKATSGYLPREKLVELGHVIQREDEFEERYGPTYRKWWFEEMERVIISSSVAPKGIGAGGILRINEVLFEERVNERFYGWETSAGVNFQTTAPFTGQARRDPGASFGLRYAKPIGWKHQVSGRIDLASPLTGRFGKEYKLTFSKDYVYEMSNRIDFILRDNLALDILGGTGTKNRHIISNVLSAAFIFFVENKTTFSVNAQFDKVEGSPLLQSYSGNLNYRIF